jgi:hypothetical protein
VTAQRKNVRISVWFDILQCKWEWWNWKVTFGVLRTWIQRSPELWTPLDFQQCSQSFFDNPGHRPFEKYQNDSEKIPQCMRTKRHKRTETVLTEFKDWDRLHLGHADPPCFNKRFLNLFHPILNSQSFWEIFLLMSALALSN